jgi:hypothetical protein
MQGQVQRQVQQGMHQTQQQRKCSDMCMLRVYRSVDHVVPYHSVRTECAYTAVMRVLQMWRSQHSCNSDSCNYCESVCSLPAVSKRRLPDLR